MSALLPFTVVGGTRAGNVRARSSRRPGRAVVRVERAPDRSVVTQAYAASPLRLLTPANHGHAAWIFSSTYGGGLVGGDVISVQVTLAAGASAVLSTQASTKVFRSPLGTLVEMQAVVEERGLLVALPDPVVCFAASRYRQEQRIELKQGAGLVLVDWLSSGRRESGERWAFDEYVTRTIVRDRGKLLLHDATTLRKADGDLAARLGRFDVLALVAIVGTALGDEISGLVAEMNRLPLSHRADELVAATRLGDTACILRIAGRSVEQVGRRIRGLLAFVPALLGDDPWSRKW